MIGTIQYATSDPSALHEASEAEDIILQSILAHSELYIAS